MATTRPSAVIVEKCKNECNDPKKGKNEVACCVFDCQSQALGTFIDGKFQNEVFIGSFSESRTEKVLSDEWKSVVKKSVDECTKKSKKFFYNCLKILYDSSSRPKKRHSS